MVQKKILILLFIFFIFKIYPENIKFSKIMAKKGDSSLIYSTIKFYDTKSVIITNSIEKSVDYFFNEEEVSEKKETILDLSGDTPSKIRVEYIKALKNQNSEISEGTIQPVSGKFYDLEKSGDSFSIKDKDGNIPEKNELNFIKNDYAKLEFGSKFNSIKAGILYNSGENIKELEEEFKSYFISGASKETDKVSFTSLKITLKGTKIFNKLKCAALDVKSEIFMSAGEEFDITLNLDGEIYISLETSYIVFINLNGPLILKGEMESNDQNEKTKLKISGKFLWENRYEYDFK